MDCAKYNTKILSNDITGATRLLAAATFQIKLDEKMHGFKQWVDVNARGKLLRKK